MARQINRRKFAASSFAAATAAYLTPSLSGGNAIAQTDGTPVADLPFENVVGESLMPAWRFMVTIFEDAYRGTIKQPADAPPGTRFVGAEVVISNESDQPLEFRVNAIRLRDSRGFQYTAGETIGSEPRVVSQNLPDRERTRGWVWFLLPGDAEVTELVFEGPAPLLRVSIPSES